MAKNDMPGMRGNTPVNPYEGNWGPIGGGNAAPYGGNPVPWAGQQQPNLLARLAAQRNQGQQNPNAAFNRPQMPSQGMQQGQPFLGLQPPGMMGNANGGAVGNMEAASSMGPSQPQMLLAKMLQMQQQQPSMQQAPMAQGAMLGGNIPPDANALQSMLGSIGGGAQMDRMPMIRGGGAEEQAPAQQSMAPSGGFLGGLRRFRNG